MIDKAKIIKEAQKFVAKGQLDKAVAEYAKIVKAFPNDTNTHNIIGDLQLKRGEKEEAISAFRTAADILNKDGFALKAIALYKKVLNINPDQVDVQIQMGKLNAERGMLGNANENYLAAISYFTKQGKKDKALDIYKVLCNLNPNNMALAQKLAELYMSEGMVNEGVGKYIELAEKKAVEGDIQAARQYLGSARAKGSDRHDYGRVTAFVNLKDGRLPEAVSQLETLRDLDHTDVKVGSLLADSYLMSGRYEDAALVLEDQLVSAPGNADIRYRLINIYIKAGIYSSAWNHYRVMIDAHIEKNEHNKAEKLVQDYLAHDADSIEARQVLVDLYSNIGRNDKISALYMDIADIHTRNGNTVKASNIYNKLLETEPDNEDIKAALAGLANAAQKQAEEKAAPVPVTEEPEVSEEREGIPEEKPVTKSLFGDREEGSFEYQPEAEPPTEAASGKIFDSVEESAGQEEPPETSVPVFELDDDLSFGQDVKDLSFVEEDNAPAEAEGPGNVYDLSDMPDVLPPLDLGQDTDAGLDEIPGFQETTYEINEEDADGIGGLDIFKEEGIQEDYQDDPQEIKLVSSAGSLDLSDLKEGPSGAPAYDLEEPPLETYTPPAMESSGAPPEDLPAYEEPSGFEDKLTEVDVYIKYGLYPKAHETLKSLEAKYPSNPEIYSRYLDLCKADGDLEGFVERSLHLAGIYRGREMDDEARKVIEKAIELAPGDERLTMLSGGGMPGVTAFDEGHEEGPADEETVEDEGTLDHSGRVLPHKEGLGMAAGSVGFYEELAEADFYAQQGLLDDAMTVYRRLLASDPENDIIRAKYDDLSQAIRQQAEQESVEEQSFEDVADELSEEAPRVPEPEYEGPAPAVSGKSELDNELDAAFSDMGFDDGPEKTSSADVSVETPEMGPVDSAEAASPEADEEDDGFFDLAAELRDEIGADIITPTPTSGYIADNNLDEVFNEFKRGVEDQVGHEDYDTHYNLGIAYKEMGMIEDALSEFNQASRDPSRTLDCASMLGLCYLEKGDYQKAIEYFKKGLDVPDHANEEYLGLKYDMATAHELSGDIATAFSVVSDIFRQDESFRDIKKRFQRLEKAAAESAQQQSAAKSAATTPKPKNKVSYL